MPKYLVPGSNTGIKFTDFYPWALNDPSKFTLNLEVIFVAAATGTLVISTASDQSNPSAYVPLSSSITDSFYLIAGTYSISLTRTGTTGILAYNLCDSSTGGTVSSGINITASDIPITFAARKTYRLQILIGSNTAFTACPTVQLDPISAPISMLAVDTKKYSPFSWYQTSQYGGSTGQFFYKFDVYATTGGTVKMTYPYNIGPATSLKPLYIPSSIASKQIEAIPSSGFAFSQWVLESSQGSVYSTSNPLQINYTDTQLTAYNRIYAVFCIGSTCTAPAVPNPDNTLCVQTLTQAPTGSGQTIFTGSSPNNGAYGSLGFLIYNINGYDSIGNPTPSGSYAVLGDASFPNAAVRTYWASKLGVTSGIWNPANPQYVGILSLCAVVNVPTSKIYYVGTAGDNGISIAINGPGINQTIVSQTANSGLGQNFQYWHIYPVYLQAGSNILTLSNNNVGSDGAFGAEIYDNTLAQLSAATSNAGLSILFSTSTYRTGGVNAASPYCTNFTCPTNYSYNPATGLCQTIVSTPLGCSPTIISFQYIGAAIVGTASLTATTGTLASWALGSSNINVPSISSTSNSYTFNISRTSGVKTAFMVQICDLNTGIVIYLNNTIGTTASFTWTSSPAGRYQIQALTNGSVFFDCTAV